MTLQAGNYSELLSFLSIEASHFRENLSRSRKIVDYVRQKTGGLNYWQVSESELSFIYAVVASMKPEIVVETGVGPGTTSYSILSALESSGGRLLSFDLGVDYGENVPSRPIGFVVPAELKKRWKIVLGNTRDTLPANIGSLGPPDIFLHDSDHSYDHVTFELETARGAMKDRFLMLLDNCDWTNATNDFAMKYGYVTNRIVDDMCYIHP